MSFIKEVLKYCENIIDIAIWLIEALKFKGFQEKSSVEFQAKGFLFHYC